MATPRNPKHTFFTRCAQKRLTTASSATAEGGALVAAAGVIFILPFLALSAIGGELADKHDKAVIAEKLKRWEILIAGLAVAGIALSSIWVLLLALFGFGVVSALFGPIKYGILPDHLERRELPAANAWIEGGTFIAILTGTIAAAVSRKVRTPSSVARGVKRW